MEAISEGYAAETSLSRMTRVATEARSKDTREWITAHVRPERRYRPPPGGGLRRPPLRRARPWLGDNTSSFRGMRPWGRTGSGSERLTPLSAGGA